jgi:metalloendopeptidase OMA1, mitochondrial
MDRERRRLLQYLAAYSLGSCLCTGCRNVPMTNRKQLLLMPETQEVTMGLSAFDDVKKKEPPSTNQPYIQLVSRVGQRIATAANRPDYKWEFVVIAAETQNAFCLPGGKVAVYEGIIPVCANEAGLAVVMSHEISHALARHGGERMSQNMAVDKAKEAVSYITRNQDQTKKDLMLQAYGVASQYGVILPYSRKHESEADHMGIQLMAKAGYDPAEAPQFWQRFGAVQAGSKPAEFLSTHPSDERRAADLQGWLAEANQMYATSANKYGQGESIAAARPAAPGAAPAAGSAPNSVVQGPASGPGPAASVFAPPPAGGPSANAPLPALPASAPFGLQNAPYGPPLSPR